MTPQEIILKHGNKGIIEAMKEYARQERDKALDLAAES